MIDVHNLIYYDKILGSVGKLNSLRLNGDYMQLRKGVPNYGTIYPMDTIGGLRLHFRKQRETEFAHNSDYALTDGTITSGRYIPSELLSGCSYISIIPESIKGDEHLYLYAREFQGIM